MWNDENSYVLEMKTGLILFDCGCGDILNQIFENMQYWGLNPDDIKYCLLTHPHLDHTEGAHLLKKEVLILLRWLYSNLRMIHISDSFAKTS